MVLIFMSSCLRVLPLLQWLSPRATKRAVAWIPLRYPPQPSLRCSGLERRRECPCRPQQVSLTATPVALVCAQSGQSVPIDCCCARRVTTSLCVCVCVFAWLPVYTCAAANPLLRTITILTYFPFVPDHGLFCSGAGAALPHLIAEACPTRMGYGTMADGGTPVTKLEFVVSDGAW